MTVQIFLQGKLLGIEDFLKASGPDSESLLGRSRWVSLAAEVLPRALLKELGLASVLLGSSGGGQFLVVLPAEFQARADAFLEAAAREIEALSGRRLNLIWASTENLGEWSLVRKRLNDALSVRRGAPAALADETLFDSFEGGSTATSEEFAGLYGAAFDMTESVSWSPESPARFTAGSGGKHTWRLGTSAEPLLDWVPLARHRATADFAMGRLGVLRVDTDGFAGRLRRVDSIEAHVETSLLYKNFFAGELQAVLASVPDLAPNVTILYSGGDDFCVMGSWQALIVLAREIERVFQLLASNNLREFPGAEGKTITAALAVSSPGGDTAASLYAEAGRHLELAKTGGRDSFYLFGRSLDWKQLGDAEELTGQLTRLIRDFECSPQFLSELRTFYREGTGAATRRRTTRFDKPWRFYRRLQRVLEPSAMGRRREREFERLCNSVIAEFIGKQAGQTRLRPTGRVALEWAQLALER